MPRDATQSYQGRLVLLLAIYDRHFCAPAVECGRDRLLLMRLGLRVVLAGSGARMQTAGAVELPAASCTVENLDRRHEALHRVRFLFVG